MDDARELSKLIGLIYEASGRHEAWPRFLEALSETLGVPAVNFNYFAPSREGGSAFPAYFGHDPDAIARYEAHFRHADPWIEAGIQNLPNGRVFEGRVVLSQEEHERTEYYNEWYGPQGFETGFGGGVLEEPSGALAAITCHRAHGRCADEAWQREFLQLLFPHLQRSLQIQVEFDAVGALRAGAAAMLDRLPVGAILVDARRHVVQTNRRADEILALNDGVAIGRDGLRAARAAQTAQLERAIAGATATARGADCATGGAFTLLRPSGRLPLRVLVSPLARESVIAPNPNAFAIVLVSDDTGSRCVSPDALEGLYGLTPAEAALAALLVEGLTLQQAAAARGVVVETARSHLKRIFAKTGTTRQSELVRLLLLGPAAFGH